MRNSVQKGVFTVNKKLTCMILMLVMMVTCCAFAEDAAPVPSITVVEIVLPAGVVVNEEAPLVLDVKQVEPESVEKAIMDEIIEVVQEPEASVATYFDEETKAAITEVLNEVLAEILTETLPEGATAELPEGFEVKLEDFQIDEFVAMTLEGYVAEYGEVEAEFAFTTEYVEEDILIVMIGIMPTEEEIAALETEAADADEAAEETAEEAEATVASLIQWIPLKAEVVDGKVKVAFGEDVLTMVNEQGAVMMVLRADNLAADEAAEPAAEAAAE